MIFRNFAERMLGSKAKLRVLLYILSEDVPASERETAKILGISHTAVNKIMKEFYDTNLVIPIRIGNVNAWKLNKNSYAFAAVSDIVFLSKNPPLKKLKDDIQGWLLSYPGVKKAVIYGSLSEGRELPESDIDLFVLLNEEEGLKKNIIKVLSDKIQYCVEFYGNKLSPYVLTIKEATNRKKQRLIKNIENGIKVI